MNRELHAMGVNTLLSVWPHFSPGTQFYDMLQKKGWLIHKPDGTPDSGWLQGDIGPNIDTTNPEAAKWWWEKIRDRYVKPYGFDYIWLDETEPDIDPAKDMFSIGSGTRFYNVYPLFHTASVYEGFRRDFGDSRQSDDPGAGGVPGGATQWHSVLVERHRFDMGHAETLDTGRAELYCERNAVLGHGYRRVLLAGNSRRLSCRAQAADRWVGCTRQDCQL